MEDIIIAVMKQLKQLKLIRKRIGLHVVFVVTKEQYTRSNATTASLVGETGRNLNTRLTKHKTATKNGDNYQGLSPERNVDKRKSNF